MMYLITHKTLSFTTIVIKHMAITTQAKFIVV